MGVDGHPFPDDCLDWEGGVSAKDLTASRQELGSAPREPSAAAATNWQVRVAVIAALVTVVAVYVTLGYGVYLALSRLL
jgi:hypothetical protein